jgi:hypothetical protein
MFSVSSGAQRLSIVLLKSSLASSSWLSSQPIFGLGNSCRAGLYAEPLENAVDVVANRSRAAVNNLRYLPISFALRYPGKNLALAGSESDR